MTVFISYARANSTAAEQLRDDVERCHRDVWLDRELTGGQAWWRTILQHIRECDVFLVVLSTDWVQSTACDLELRYAIALNRPVLPVMVTKMDHRLAPPAVVDAQIVDYRQRSPETVFALRDALDTLPKAPPLPSPMPAEPAAPISYLHDIIIMLNAPSLNPGEQYDLWQRLQAVLDEDDADSDERRELLKLVRRLRKRRDLVPSLPPLIDAVLGDAPRPPHSTDPSLAQGPPTVPLPQDATAPTQLIHPPAPTRKRAHRGLVWAAASLGVILAISLSIGIALANRDPTGDGGSQTTSTTTVATTTSETVAPTETTRPTRRTTTTTTRKPVTFEVPSLVGRTLSEAQAELRGLKGKGWKGSLHPSDAENPDRRIVDQAPRPGSEIGVHDSINVKLEPEPAQPPASEASRP